MSKQPFDDRYPAMFQPGGEAMPAGIHLPVTPADTIAPAAAPAAVPVMPQAPGQYSTASDAQEALAATGLPIPAAAGLAGTEPVDSNATADPGAGAKSPWLLWRVPAIVGALLLSLGVLLPVLPFWIAKSSGDPNEMYAGEMWAYVASQAAAPMVGVGAGALALLLFLYTQQHPTRREGLRRLFAIASAAVLAAGLFAQFATYIYPPIRHESVDSLSGQSTFFMSPSTFVSLLGLFAFGPLVVGLLMFAALAISHKTSLIRAYTVGLLLVAVAVFSQFAQKIFPNVPLSTQYYEGGNQGIPGWPSMLPMLTPALVAAGVIVIAAAALGPVITAVIRTPRDAPQAGRLDEQNDEVEQAEDHVQPEL